jgi:hypothetical protein
MKISPAVLWAKLQRDSLDHVNSLVDHSADVAAVLEGLTKQSTVFSRVSRDPAWGYEMRRRLARDYYRAEFRAEHFPAAT